MRRVNEGVREVVSSALAGSARDKLAGFVTITDVETSPICITQRVYVSVFGRRKRRAATRSKHSKNCGSDLQGEIADHLRMKNTPILQIRERRQR